ncbi:hypothetical protein Vadar_024231 [Vaccinium darrowii]|uniref:Uncharacterized protein n=1 Tax=Vaccinium darrowii TaxID=229202 RepID=A0ACB7XKE1_9ERIC|nr:hypothetical protein Vadar_024231 [Vaccinium darrowii]
MLSDLYRYIHYHNRYKAHTDSFKLESNLKETVREKTSNLEKKDSSLLSLEISAGLQMDFTGSLDQATKAVEVGVPRIVVSNLGACLLDYSSATITVL